MPCSTEGNQQGWRIALRFTRLVMDNDSIGPFDIEVLPITIRFLKACVLSCIRLKGSWSTGTKIDREPIDGRTTDIGRLKELSEGRTFTMDGLDKC